MGKRKPREERVAELVDSPGFRQRRRAGNNLSARFEGSLGLYRLKWNLRTKLGSCSCPADFVCKHLEALQRTWQKRPESFLDEATPGLQNEFEEHDRRLQQALDAAKALFRSGKCPSMADAALEVARKMDFDGDFEIGETGELVFLLEALCPEGNLYDWTNPEQERGRELTEDEILQEQENYRKLRDLKNIEKVLRHWITISEKHPAGPGTKRAAQEAKRNRARRELADRAEALDKEWYELPEPGPAEYWKRVDEVLKKGRKFGVSTEEQNRRFAEDLQRLRAEGKIP